MKFKDMLPWKHEAKSVATDPFDVFGKSMKEWFENIDKDWSPLMRADRFPMKMDIVEIGESPDAKLPAAVVERIRAAAGTDAGRIDWAIVRQAVLERRGYPVLITRPETSSSALLAQ